MLDYEIIRNVLTVLREAYPRGIYYSQAHCLAHMGHEQAYKVLFYLKGHGMIDFAVQETLGGQIAIGKVSITAKGIDFLEPDGGLTALAAPVIRLSPDSLVAILNEALAARDIPAEEKGVIRKMLESAGAEGLKTIVQDLVRAGIKYAPDLLRTLSMS